MAPAVKATTRPRVRLTERACELSGRLARAAGRGSPSFTPVSSDSTRRGDLPRGARVGPYRVIRAIGRGGMSVVYEGRHAELDARVALKVAKFDDPDDPQCRERLFLESLVLEQLRTPSIPALRDVGVLDDGRPWIAIELIEGRSLTDRIAAAPVDVAEACDLVAAIASALGDAHARGVIHRDLKPDNVIVLDRVDPGTPAAKVIDWGIARTRHLPDARITEIGVVSGTPLYMAPEQARGREVDGACDVYALGVIAYEMLCGEPPFDGENSVEILLQHINDAPRLPGSLRPDLPAWLGELVLAMLAKAPSARPTTAAIVAAIARGKLERELDRVFAELEREQPAIAACAAAR